MRGGALCVGWLLLFGSARADEASTGIVADRLVPAVGPTAGLTLETAEVTPPGSVSWAGSLGYLRDPIGLRNQFTGAPLSRPVHEALVTDVSAEVGLWRRIAVAVGVPVVLAQNGDRLQKTGVDDRPLSATVAGELRLRLKAQLVGELSRPGPSLAALVQATAPTGGQSDFAATSTATVEPRLVAQYRVSGVLVGASLGARFAGDRSLFQTQFGDELTWAGGGQVRLWTRGHFEGAVLFEAAGQVGAAAGTRPVELRGALRTRIGPVGIDLGGGGGVTSDVGAPSFRVFAIVRGNVGKSMLASE